MKSRRRIPIESVRRRGLAMLELVLCLPIMLFVMALMMNFGTMASWKIRAQHNTKYAAWRTLRDRTGQHDPHPAHWPQLATLSTSGGRAMSNANAVWNRDPALTTPVTRGPVIVEADQGLSIVVPGRFNMDASVHAGDAGLRRKTPLLRRLLRDDGAYGFTEHQELLDNRWEYRHLAMPRNPYDRGGVSGDGGNRARRAKRWYRLDPPFFSQLQVELGNLARADGLLKTNPARFNLDTLDRDDEFLRIRGSSPDFHPTYDPRPITNPRRACTTDVLVVRGQTQRTINNIQRLPGRMGNAFASLYRGEIRRLQALDPPPIAEIAALERKLRQVERFLRALPRRYR